MHELLAVEITKCGDDLLTIEKDNLTDWSEKLQVTPILPGLYKCRIICNISQNSTRLSQTCDMEFCDCFFQFF